MLEKVALRNEMTSQRNPRDANGKVKRGERERQRGRGKLSPQSSRIDKAGDEVRVGEMR